MRGIKRSSIRWMLGGLVWLGAAAGEGARAREPEVYAWQKPYAGEAATGTSVLALWPFQPGAERLDASGNGHDLVSRGRTAFRPEGPFGGCLEAFGPGDTDQAGGARALSSEKLTPPGALTIEMWIKPSPEFITNRADAWLLDKMGIAYKHDDPSVECRRDYALRVGAPEQGAAPLIAHLGFGEAVATFRSNPVRLDFREWRHVAFVYDGAGAADFYCDGEKIGGGRAPGRGGVAPGSRPVVIGDRVGSRHGGFPGLIGQVRLSSEARRFYSGKVALAPSGRTVFLRMETPGRMEWRLENTRETALAGARLEVSVGEGEPEGVRIPDLESGAAMRVDVPVDTALRPGRYAVRAAVRSADGSVLASVTNAFVTLVPRPLARMPVILWGRVRHTDTPKYELMKHIGFTHSFCWPPYPSAHIWETGQPVSEDPERSEMFRRELDHALAHDHGLVFQIVSTRWLAENRPEMRRVNRAGVPYADRAIAENPCGLCPGAADFCYHVGASIAQSYGDHPAWRAALIHSEVRDSTEVCFHDVDRAAFRDHAGFDIPPQVSGKNGVHYQGLPDFPTDRVIEDDNPLLTYYRWFWKEGDGWNAIHSAMHRGLKTAGRPDVWTWYDPAVRVPSVTGSGGEVDVLSQWSYSNPDPIRIAQATDELFAMAAGAAAPQRVMKMTQIIWYRSLTAPKPKPGEEDRDPAAAWKDAVPGADFLTIAPDHLRAAFWTKIARPVQGIMYHGWDSLVDCGKTNGYCYTHPEAQTALADLVRDVVTPLGPTLLQVPDIECSVGYLESFAAQMFAGRGSRGWSRDPMYLVVQYAQLQPRVLFDETVMAGGIEGLKVLFMPDCDVLPRGLADRVREFQRAGGLIVADEFLAPALTADIVIAKPGRTGRADADKAAIQAAAAELRAQLDPLYRRPADSSNPDVIARLRRYGATDYLFAVNDRRTFGDYVGPWGLVMEKGMPSEAVLSLDRRAGYAYDLVAGRPIPAEAAGGRLEIARSFGPGGGGVVMVTDRAIAGVAISAPGPARLGRPAALEIVVVDADGAPLDAVVPIRVDLLDPRGIPAEGSGIYGARDGRLTLTLDLAVNDEPGAWVIRARELASGRTAEAAFRVE